MKGFIMASRVIFSSRLKVKKVSQITRPDLIVSFKGLFHSQWTLTTSQQLEIHQCRVFCFLVFLVFLAHLEKKSVLFYSGFISLKRLMCFLKTLLQALSQLMAFLCFLFYPAALGELLVISGSTKLNSRALVDS